MLNDDAFLQRVAAPVVTDLLDKWANLKPDILEVVTREYNPATNTYRMRVKFKNVPERGNVYVDYRVEMANS